MKQKKVLGLAALAMGALTLTGAPRVMAADAPAAGATTAKPKHEKKKADAAAMLKKLTASLTLTQDEQDKIKPILTDEATQINGLDASLTKEQKQEKVAAIRKAAAEQIAPLLTAEQKAKFEKHHAKAEDGKDKKDAKPKAGK